MAFSNGNGGIILFGMTGGRNPIGFERPEHEISLSIAQFVSNTSPRVDIEVSDPIATPHNPEKVLVAVSVEEAERKPVMASDSSFFVRIADHKDPVPWAQLQSMFVEADRRQMAVRRLEMEIERFKQIFESQIQKPPDNYRFPPIELIDEKSLKEVFKDNVHLFDNEDNRDIILGILKLLDNISSTKRDYLEASKNTGRGPYGSWGELNTQTQITLYDLCNTLNTHLNSLVRESQLEISD